MRYLVDTTVIAAWLRGQILAERVVATAGDAQVALSVITASELLNAVHWEDGAQRRWQRQAFVESLIKALPLLPIDAAIARTRARLVADLARASVVVRESDLLLAATALTYGLAIATHRPQRFRHFDGLEVTAW